MNKKIMLILTIICSIFHHSYAQIQGVDNVVGKNYLIQSEVLKEERKIQVFLPNSYEESDKKYPVLFILDGQRLFPYGVSLSKSFTKFNLSPDFIVVGISNKYPQRFGHFSSGAQDFLKFIEQDAIAFIDNKFRTSGERLLFGWEYAGGFVIQTMIDKSTLFDSYITASPFPLNAPDLSISDRRLKQLDSLFAIQKNFDKVLYFTADVNEGMVKDGTDDLSTLLVNRAPKNMNWTYRKLEGEEHQSTPYATLYHGIRTYYHYYPELQFESLEEYTKAGGMPYVYDYQEQRAKKFGFSPELTSWTKFTLIRNAIRANNYVQFDDFVKQFKTVDFIGSLRGSRPYSIAEFYQNHEDYDKAVDIYKILAKKYPNSERPLNSLVDVYTVLKDDKNANKYYQKAKELTKKNSN